MSRTEPVAMKAASGLGVSVPDCDETVMLNSAPSLPLSEDMRLGPGSPAIAASPMSFVYEYRTTGRQLCPTITSEGTDMIEATDYSCSTLGDMSKLSVDIATDSSRLPSEDIKEQKSAMYPLAPPLTLPDEEKVGIVYDKSMELHVGPEEHVECPERTAKLFDTLKRLSLMQRCWTLEPRKATTEELLLGHTADHIAQVEEKYDPSLVTEDEPYVLEGDNYYGPNTADVTRMAAGCCIQAVQDVVRGKVSSAMAVVRPPGHHAECNRAMGFCFYNNTALAALAALQEPGVERVVVLDWDVHHGNGIQHMLEREPRALYISIHRADNFYPYDSGFAEEVGVGSGEGFNVNIPWSRKGEGDADYLAAFDVLVEPVLREYDPQLIIVSAGFDAAEGDPLGGCLVTPAGYAHMTRRLLAFAGGRLVLALEGGYNTRQTAECAAECVRVLLGEEPPPLPPPGVRRPAHPLRETERVLRRVDRLQAKYWPSLDRAPFQTRWHAFCLELDMARLAVSSSATDTDSGIEIYV